MKIHYALYELEASHSLNAASSTCKRVGALLKILFDSKRIGYADCHPWPELGDLPLTQQLENLARGEFTPLTYCAKEFAALDAEARFLGKQLFISSPVPRSHFLVTSLLDWTAQDVQNIIQQGYTHVKLKVGRDLEQEIQKIETLFLQTPLKLRLDFNETLSLATFRFFLQRMQKFQEQMDFIEDPFPFHVQEWKAIQKEGWTLACDRQAPNACQHPESAHVLIVKPALHPFEAWQTWSHQTRIVTSYLGHPLGQLAAAYVACQVDPCCHFVHGLLSHHAYRPTAFSQHLNWQNPQWVNPPGRGCSFDQELEQLEWISLQ